MTSLTILTTSGTGNFDIDDMLEDRFAEMMNQCGNFVI